MKSLPLIIVLLSPLLFLIDGLGSVPVCPLAALLGVVAAAALYINDDDG